MYQFFEYWTQSKIFWFNTIYMNRRYYKNTMSNIQQLLDPFGYITFLKYEATIEKILKKNLILYITNLKILYIKAKVSLTKNFLSLWTE